MIEPITVVTATVNRPTLRRAVESVQAQTLKPVRHCILLQQLMRSPEIEIQKPLFVPIEILWIPPPQPNIVEAYNLADAMARTPWVAMLDDDCWWEPEHLEALATLMGATGSDFVWGSSIAHDVKTGEEVYRRQSGNPAFQCIDTNEILFRKTCIERWGGFRIEDCDPEELPKLRGIDGRRIERWVKGGATYAHSRAFTINYGWRERPEF
jgi:glycosyltransferase involved in cell wall biosynthesis